MYWLRSRGVEAAKSLVLEPCTEEDAKEALTTKSTGKRIDAHLVENVLFGITDGGHVAQKRLVEAIMQRTDKKQATVERALQRGIKSGELEKFIYERGQWALPEMIASAPCGAEGAASANGLAGMSADKPDMSESAAWPAFPTTAPTSLN
jgi:hypothetical protein